MKIKVFLKGLVLRALTATGRYRPFDPSESEWVIGEAVPYSGEIPTSAGKENKQHILRYKTGRSPQEVHDLIYTPEGMAWKDGTLYRRYSLREPSTRELWYPPTENPSVIVPEGVIVQGETPYTYGDWFCEHLCSLAGVLPLTAPLLMPHRMMEKPYVRRDLDYLGIETIVVDSPILIRRAIVLRKMWPMFHIPREAVDAVRRSFHADPVPPRPGSVLYLSREGFRGEHRTIAQRSYPSEAVGVVMRELGAKVVLTRETTLEQYRELASEAETVVADTGSALYNLIFWKTKHVIELFNDDYWGNAFVLLGHALGIKDYALVKVNHRTPEEIRQQVVRHMRDFGAPKGQSSDLFDNAMR
jgi:hypothetical protein